MDVKMPTIKDSNIVKIAVEMKNQVAQLIEFNQKQPLEAIIQDLANGWGVTEPDQYALQFADKPTENCYITEKNRSDIKNGSILKLALSPAKTGQDILNKLNNGTDEEKTKALKELSKLNSDITFASEFISKQGLALLIALIEGGKCSGELLAYGLLSFLELMDHGSVSWDILEPLFINKIASYINNQSQPQDPKTLQVSLSILENIVLNGSGKYALVEKEVTMPNLVTLIQNTSPVIQQNAIALINALFLKADISKRKVIAGTLSSKQTRNKILNNVIQSSSGQVGTEMAHQLYILQALTFNLLEERMNLKMESQDQDAHEKIRELRRIAFDMEDASANKDNTTRRHAFAKDYKRLGFKNDINPALDFVETPPGMLALDCMVYFARHHREHYTKVVLENSCRADEHECPFGRTSIELTKLLCEMLNIGETPDEQGQNYHPMFFTHDHPFEECFCICILLLNKTWKEMRATIEDFTKVFSVVREQITRALASSPTTLEKFRTKLATLTYLEITNLWQQERSNREEWESHARPIVELREQITPEIIELIQQQRLGYLVEGSRFTKYSSRGQRIKDKFWYCRLSPNFKVFHYGDCDEKSTPALEELPNKLAVLDIKALAIGKECPHVKDTRGRSKTTHVLAFSLILDAGEVGSLDFVAPDEATYFYWTDGINTLLGHVMTSKLAMQDLETLLSMDIKLRLLDTEGVNIPQDPPPIPPDPPNYDFCCDFK